MFLHIMKTLLPHNTQHAAAAYVEGCNCKEEKVKSDKQNMTTTCNINVNNNVLKHLILNQYFVFVGIINIYIQ